jgi:hypothetical protein
VSIAKTFSWLISVLNCNRLFFRVSSLQARFHLAQLEAFMGFMPDPPDSLALSEAVAGQPTTEVYQWVFATCLMHATYRPNDPERILWALTDKAVPLHWEGYERSPPTNIVGLYTITSSDLTLLVWGQVERLDADEISIKLTFYDSKAAIRSDDMMEACLTPLAENIAAALSPTFTVKCITGFRGVWPTHLLSLSEEELGFIFCQLISTVMHDMPYDQRVFAEGPPVYPVWPLDLTRDRTYALLSQVSGGTLRLQDILEGGGLVPECIYLHG